MTDPRARDPIGTSSQRLKVVRAAYERFNARDFEGVLELFDPDVELHDLLLDGVVVRGRETILRQWQSRFAAGSARVMIGSLLEMHDHVLAIVSFQAYDAKGIPIGSPTIIAHRFVFESDRVVQLARSLLD